MFFQIHMLQSMPPCNLNRDDTGQPKKCLFGGVTRGRISSQCLKRNIRLSVEFSDAFGGTLASRTTYLPQMVADEIRQDPGLEIPEDDIYDLMLALARMFKKNDVGGKSAAEGDEDEQESPDSANPARTGAVHTPQLVFIQQPFARRISELVSDLRKGNPQAYNSFLDPKKKPKPSKEEVSRFIEKVSDASKSLTVDIALFGRMTTSDLVVNVEAACQVAHAISTHETVIESDYFTAMDDLKPRYAVTQTEKAGAAFLGSGESETFFNSAVYYKYLNLDIDAMKKYLPSLSDEELARVAEVLVRAAALSNPTGKQNSFAAHGVPDLILVEATRAKRPLSYANAFLQPVEGGIGRNLMTESAKALCGYIDSVAAAFAPADVRRQLLAVGPAAVPLKSAHDRVTSLDGLVESVAGLINTPGKAEGNA